MPAIHAIPCDKVAVGIPSIFTVDKAVSSTYSMRVEALGGNMATLLLPLLTVPVHQALEALQDGPAVAGAMGAVHTSQGGDLPPHALGRVAVECHQGQ